MEPLLYYIIRLVIKVLEKYVNMWEPLNFVTRKEVERIVREVLEEKFNSDL